MNKLIVSLATRFGVTVATIKRHLKPQNIEQWGKLQRIDGGDTMNASALQTLAGEDRRDATFVRVSGNALVFQKGDLK
jgi:DeoR/GlpR family transcriptional regulator of sugar metabolism